MSPWPPRAAHRAVVPVGGEVGDGSLPLRVQRVRVVDERAGGRGEPDPVGAVAVLMVNMTAATSLRTGAAAALGAATADAGYAVAAVLGGSAAPAEFTPAG